jgi:phospholipid N-methyltransferase
MFDGLELCSGDVVLEYGPGTGSFTVEIERLRGSGIDVRYLGIEKDPGMHRFLERRFPDLDFVLGDAADVESICRSRGLPPAAAIISGLPLIFLDRPALETILAGTSQCLGPRGVFRTFSYLHSYPSRSAGELRTLMDQCFERFDLSNPVLRNLPPAFVLSGSCPRTMEDAGSLGLAMAPVLDQFPRR